MTNMQPGSSTIPEQPKNKKRALCPPLRANISKPLCEMAIGLTDYPGRLLQKDMG